MWRWWLQYCPPLPNLEPDACHYLSPWGFLSESPGSAGHSLLARAILGRDAGRELVNFWQVQHKAELLSKRREDLRSPVTSNNLLLLLLWGSPSLPGTYNGFTSSGQNQLSRVWPYGAVVELEVKNMYIYTYAFIFMCVEMEGKKEGLQGEKVITQLEKNRRWNYMTSQLIHYL